ncbi:serine hydrolase-like protein 2 [Oculina patagonica]
MADKKRFSNSCKEISFNAPWGVIAAKAWGPEDGKPFLGLHGWLDNANTFDKLARLLPENIRFIAMDFPGHGKSSHRWPGMPYHHFEYVADVKKVVSQLGWEKFSIIAHSMGAFVASLYAGSFPNEVESLVLLDYGGPPALSANKPAKGLAKYATRMSNMNPRTPRVYESVEAAAVRREVSLDGNTLRKEDSLLLTKRGTTVTKDGVIFSHDPIHKALVFPFLPPQSSLKLIFSKIQCAVLVLEATDTVYMFDGDQETHKERLNVICDHAKFKMWKSIKSGHHLHLDNPEQTAQEIKNFLACVSSHNHDSCTSKL